jgi:extradiol dioxygenase family protein
LRLSPFHLAIPVTDLDQARHFYGGILCCEEGRSSERWTDFNFFGHQLVCHLTNNKTGQPTNPVDGHDVPVPHFGIVLEMSDWQRLTDQLKAAGVKFLIQPHIRFAGKAGEQATMFILDPSGNALEFKAFSDIEGQLFKKH